MFFWLLSNSHLALLQSPPVREWKRTSEAIKVKLFESRADVLVSKIFNMEFSCRIWWIHVKKRKATNTLFLLLGKWWRNLFTPTSYFVVWASSVGNLARDSMFSVNQIGQAKYKQAKTSTATGPEKGRKIMALLRVQVRGINNGHRGKVVSTHHYLGTRLMIKCHGKIGD